MIKIKTSSVRSTNISRSLMPFVDLATKVRAPNFYITESDLPEVGDRMVVRLNIGADYHNAVHVLGTEVSPVFSTNLEIGLHSYDPYPILANNEYATIEGLEGTYCVHKVALLQKYGGVKSRASMPALIKLIDEWLSNVKRGNYVLTKEGSAGFVFKRIKPEVDHTVLEDGVTKVVILGKCDYDSTYYQARQALGRHANSETNPTTSFLIGVQYPSTRIGINHGSLQPSTISSIRNLLNSKEDLDILKPVQEYERKLEEVLGLGEPEASNRESYIVIPIKKDSLGDLLIPMHELPEGEQSVPLMLAGNDNAPTNEDAQEALIRVANHNVEAIALATSTIAGGIVDTSEAYLNKIVETIAIHVDGKEYKSVCGLCPQDSSVCPYVSSENAMLGCLPTVGMYLDLLKDSKKNKANKDN